MSSITFESKDTKEIQSDVRSLFSAMSPDFRDHLMHSFLWSEDKFQDYLSREVVLQGDRLKDAYSHLESLLARIETFADSMPKHKFPDYDKWIDTEYKNYKTSLTEDHEDIERLIGEGGVVAPGKTAPMDTMANDSLSHYNHLKSEHDKIVQRATEAGKLIKLPEFKKLHAQAQRMCKAIMHDIHK